MDESNNQGQNVKPPTVLGDLLQPGFPLAKVFTVFFMNDSLVFAKTGSGATNAAGTLAASLGGFTPSALIAKGIGTVIDQQTGGSRDNKSAELAAYSPEEIVAGHKRNFMIKFDDVKNIEIKGPNFAGEVKVIITADRVHKFRVDKQSKEAANYIKSVFNEFLPGKVTG